MSTLQVIHVKWPLLHIAGAYEDKSMRSNSDLWRF